MNCDVCGEKRRVRTIVHAGVSLDVCSECRPKVGKMVDRLKCDLIEHELDELVASGYAVLDPTTGRYFRKQ